MGDTIVYAWSALPGMNVVLSLASCVGHRCHIKVGLGIHYLTQWSLSPPGMMVVMLGGGGGGLPWRDPCGENHSAGAYSWGLS